MDQPVVPKSPQSTTTPYDSHRRLIPANIVQIDSFRNKSMQLSPKANPSVSNAKITMVKKNLFETVTQINKNEQKLKKGTVPLSEEQQLSHSKNKSHGEFSHPITVRTQAFIQYQQVGGQENVFEGRSKSYHNLFSSATSTQPQQSIQKQKLQSMQSGIISPIEEECGTTKNADVKDKDEVIKTKIRPQSSKLAFSNHRMTSPSLMYIQHENQSPDHKHSRNSQTKFISNQPEVSLQQRQEYYIGQVGGLGSQIVQVTGENQSIEKINKEKLNQNSGQKEFNLNLRSAGSHRILRQSQNPSINVPNQDVYQNTSQTSKGVELSQNTSISSPVGAQRKSLSLKIINGNSIMNNHLSTKNIPNNSFNKMKCSSINLNGVQNQSQEKSQFQAYTPVKEEEREDNTPLLARVKSGNTAIKTPITTKFIYPQETSAFSVKSAGYGALLTTNMSNESPKAMLNTQLARKFTQDSLTQTPLPNSNTTAVTRPTSGTKLALRPYSAVNKNKECVNQFFNTVNANNFVKSSNIKKQRLVSPNSFNSNISSNLNLNTNKNNLSAKGQPEKKRQSLQSDLINLQAFSSNAFNHSQSFTSMPVSQFDNTSQLQLLQGKSNRTSINQFISFQQPLIVDTNQNSEANSQFNLNKQEYYPNHNYNPLKVFDGFEDIQEQIKTPTKLPISMNKRFSKGFNSNAANNLSHR